MKANRPQRKSPRIAAPAVQKQASHLNSVVVPPPAEQLEHDLNVKHVTDEGFVAAKKFIHACEKVGAWRLKQGQLTEDAGFYAGELGIAIARHLHALVAQGDIMLARKLPVIVEILETAMKVYGSRFTGAFPQKITIEQLLKKHKAHDLVAMVTALYPQWEKIGIPNQAKIEALPEAELSALLVSKELWVHEHEEQRTEEQRAHRLAELIENMVAVRETEAARINLFVEHLWQGRLWGLGPDKAGTQPGRDFIENIWQGQKDLPPVEDTQAWMKLVMPYLKEVTGGDVMRLNAFTHLLAARKFVYHDASGKGYGRLATDSPKRIWNQIETEIRKVWVTMAARK